MQQSYYSRLQMKRSYLGTLTSVSALLALPFSAIAQPSSDPAQSLLTDLSNRCNRATEVSYQSQRLLAPDSTTSAYASGLLRKVVGGSRRARGRQSSGTCSGSFETLNQQIMIERPSGDRPIAIAPDRSNYLVYQPRSFSADSRYLVMDMRGAFKGGDAVRRMSIVDTASGAIDERIKVCQHTVEGYERIFYRSSSYVGFSSPSEVVVSCNEPGLEEYFETVDLLTGRVRQLNEQPARLVNYGTVQSEFEVVRTQLFQ